MPAKAIPDGYHTITPYLIVQGAAKTIDFARKAFGAELVHEPMTMPDGRIMHAEMKIGDSRIMLSDAGDRHPPMPSMLHVYVPNVDAVYQKALKAGGASTMEPTDMFYGDRGASVKDPAGIAWYMATHTEDVPMPELEKRARKHMDEMTKTH
ncbi:MAG: VOC family protein [Pseudorhodoplanes sp.]|jgi:uncharacterized glyoxalase superfamily protein PhnB|nr:VOC family protein [Pseudorhodoplanes sp.]